MSAYSGSIAKILRGDGSAAGAGIVLDRHRVLTCAHVVNEALGNDRFARSRPNVALLLKVPLRMEGDASFHAEVALEGWVPPEEVPVFGVAEDVAILELLGGMEFPRDVSSASLVDLDLRDEHDRRVWVTGFPGDGLSDRMGGRIRGVNDQGRIQIDPEYLERVVSGGFSGAGILDHESGHTVGMLVSKRTRDGVPIAYGAPIASIAKSVDVTLRAPDNRTKARLPDLPRNFISREAFLKPLRDAVLTGANAGVTAQPASALKGMGGLGKTVLVKSLLHDPDIVASFGSERYWLTLGSERGPADAQAELLRDITGKSVSIESVSDGVKQLRIALAGRPRLLALDDLWTVEQASAFEELGAGVSIVVTTRQANVLQRFGAHALQLGLLDEQQSRELLAAWAALKIDDLPALADDVVAECGRLPLALAAFGAVVSQSGIGWRDALDAVQARELVELARPIDGYDGNEGVFGAIALSFSRLPSADQRAFARCAVVPGDQAVPIAALYGLWHDLPEFGEKPREVRRLCQRLEDASLWSRDTSAKAVSAWRIHDLVSDFLHASLMDPKAAHRAIAYGYLRSLLRPWTNEEDDGYVLDWLPHHLKEAGQHDRLRDLLLDLDWLRAKLISRGARAVAADSALLPDDHAVALVGRAVRMSAHVLDDDPLQLEAHLIGRIQIDGANSELCSLLNQARLEKPASIWVPRAGGHLVPPGPLLSTLVGHTGWVTGAHVLSDERRALSWSTDGTLRIWDLETGASNLLEGHGDEIRGTHVLDDEFRVLSWSRDGTLRIWDLDEGTSRSFALNSNYVWDVRLLDDDLLALYWAWDDNTFWVLNLETGETRPFEGHGGKILGVDVSGNERLALSWADDGMRIWNLATGTSKVIEEYAQDASILPDGRRAVSWSSTGAKLWDLDTCTSLALTESSPEWETTYVLKDRCRALSWSRAGIRIWDLETGASTKLDDASLFGVQVSDNEHYAVGWPAASGALRVWRLETKSVRLLEGHSAEVNGARIAPDGRRVLSWSRSSPYAMNCWDTDTGAVRLLEGHGGSVLGVRFLTDGRRALSWSCDRSLRLWDLHTAELAPVHINRDQGATPGKKASRRTFSWVRDKVNQLRNIETFEPRPFYSHVSEVRGVCVSKDARDVLSWSGNQSLGLFNLDANSAYILEGHRDAVRGACFLEVGRRALSWSDDGILRLWDLGTSTSRALLGHREAIYGAQVVHGGRRALTWGADGALRLWDILSGTSKAQEGHHGEIRGLLTLADESQALSWGVDGMICHWDISTDPHSPVIVGKINGRGIRRDSYDVKFAKLLSNGSTVIFSTGKYSTLYMFDLSIGIPLNAGYQENIRGACQTQKGQDFITWRDDEYSLKMWTVDRYFNAKCQRTFEGHRAPVNGVRVLADGRSALSWSSDGAIVLWDLEAGAVSQLQGHRRCVNGVHILRDERHALSWSDGGTLRLWDLNTACERGRATCDAPLTAAAVSRDETIIAVGDQHGRVMIFDLTK